MGKQNGWRGVGIQQRIWADKVVLERTSEEKPGDVK